MTYFLWTQVFGDLECKAKVGGLGRAGRLLSLISGNVWLSNNIRPGELSKSSDLLGLWDSDKTKNLLRRPFSALLAAFALACSGFDKM